MVNVTRTGFWARCVRLSVAAMVVALFGAVGLGHAACLDCTFFGTDAGAIATGTADSGFGFEALMGTRAARTRPSDTLPSAKTEKAETTRPPESVR